jgi:sulfonate transport system substrate-binding protein
MAQGATPLPRNGRRSRDQGLARMLYSSQGDNPNFYRHATFVGSQDFIEKYPEITTRVVKTLVVAAKWLSDHDSNPESVYQLWTRSGVAFPNFKEDFGKTSLKVWSSPLIDEYLIAQYNLIGEAKRYGLIKNTFRFEDWYEPSFLNAALRELGLEGYWTPYGADGKPKANKS